MQPKQFNIGFCLAGLILVSSLLLGACGATPTALPTIVPTLAPRPTSTPNLTTTPVPVAPPTPTRLITTSYNPVIGFSSSMPVVGETIVIKGSGFPATAGIEITINFVQNDGGILITPVKYKITTTSDTGGNLAAPFKLDKISDAYPILPPAELGFTVATIEKNPALGVYATLKIRQDPSKVSILPTAQEQVNKTVLDFFATLKQDKIQAWDYLSSLLKTRLASGETDYAKMLGTKSIPDSVSVNIVPTTTKFIATVTMLMPDNATRIAIVEVEKEGSKYIITKIQPGQ